MWNLVWYGADAHKGRGLGMGLGIGLELGLEFGDRVEAGVGFRVRCIAYREMNAIIINNNNQACRDAGNTSSCIAPSAASAPN